MNEKAQRDTSKKSKKEGRSKKDDKTVEQFFNSLNSLPSIDEKFSAVCKAYSQKVDENKKLKLKTKKYDRHYTLLLKEKEQLQNELNKTILNKNKLENICRELQAQNKAKDDKMARQISDIKAKLQNANFVHETEQTALRQKHQHRVEHYRTKLMELQGADEFDLARQRARTQQAAALASNHTPHAIFPPHNVFTPIPYHNQPPPINQNPITMSSKPAGTHLAGLPRPEAKRARLDETNSSCGEPKRLKLALPGGTTVATAKPTSLVLGSPSGYLSKEMADKIEEKLDEAIWCEYQRNVLKPGSIGFSNKPMYKEGSLLITTSINTTLEWVQQWVKTVNIPEVGNLVLEKPVLCRISLPKTYNRDSKDIWNILKWQNPEIKTLGGGVCQQQKDNTTIMHLLVTKSMIPVIMAKGRQLKLLSGTVYVQFLNGEGKFVDSPPSDELPALTEIDAVLDQHNTAAPAPLPTPDINSAKATIPTLNANERTTNNPAEPAAVSPVDDATSSSLTKSSTNSEENVLEDVAVGDDTSKQDPNPLGNNSNDQTSAPQEGGA